MAWSLDTILGISPQTLEWEEEVESRATAQRSRLQEMGWLTAWELQSQIATLALISLVALVPTSAALIVMIAWSLAATCLYYCFRKGGLPDVLDGRQPVMKASTKRWDRLSGAGLSLGKTWMAGLQALFYSRTFGRVLLRPAIGWRIRSARIAVLGVGLTLFGVTAAHHMLRKAGLPEERVLKLSLVGPFLNVPYRVLLSTIVLNTLWGLTHVIPT